MKYYATIKVDQAKAEEIKDYYHADVISDDNLPYEYFLVNKNNMQIHAYHNRKEIYTITFSGTTLAVKEEASQFSNNITIKEYDDKVIKEDKDKNKWEDLSSQIGSDEVGKGEFFGPLVVAASYVKDSDIEYLRSLGVDDSKKLTDTKILEIGPKLKKKIPNYITVISAGKLSDYEESGMKTNKFLALVHNLTHKGLIEKYKLSDSTIIYIDQFDNENNYKKNVGKDIVSNPLYFRTQGETYYPSVAVSSIIARYTFLLEFEKIEKELGMEIPKGSSATVDKVYAQLKKKFKQEILDKYVKRFFRNYSKD